MKYVIRGAKVAPPLRAPDPDTESMVSQQRLAYSNFPDDGAWNLKEDYEQRVRNLLEQRLLIKPGSLDMAVDIGSLNGKWEGLLFEYCDKITCVDIFSDRFNVIRERYPDKIKAKKLYFYETLGYELSGLFDRSADFIFSLDSLTNAVPLMLDSYLKEIYRVLKPGALAVINVDTRSAAEISSGTLKSELFLRTLEWHGFTTIDVTDLNDHRSHATHGAPMARGLIYAFQKPLTQTEQRDTEKA